MKIQMVTMMLSVAIATPGFGRGVNWRGSGGWGGSGCGYCSQADAAQSKVVSGKVTEVRQITPTKGMMPGVELELTPAAGASSIVHLGPEWFIAGQDLKIDKGDQLEITGFAGQYEGKPVLIAVTVRKGDESLTLRDESGRPVWAGWRRGQRPG